MKAIHKAKNNVRRFHRATASALALAALAAAVGLCQAQEYLPGIEWEKPAVVTSGKEPGAPPSDAVVLFDGKDLSQWENGDKWKVEDGVAIIAAGAGEIRTKQAFGDCQFHIEWSAPTPPTGTGQGRGNSGVFFGLYELQVLDSYQDDTYFEGQAAAIYKQTPPLVNAMRPPGEWNVYDVLWTAPRFKEDGSLESPAFITVLHNGVVVQNHFQLLGDTPYHRPPQYNQHPVEQHIRLQDHGNPVRFRNIWIRPIKPAVGKRAHEPKFKEDKEAPAKAASAETSESQKVETEDSGRTPNGHVEGAVTLDGKPLKKGKVTFFSHGAGRSFEGKITDGTFKMAKVAAGTYSVSVKSGKKVPAKYSDKDKTPLTVEVTRGDNLLSFDLTSK